MGNNDTVFPIPITILGGFLGSGKTTLLNRILQEQHGIRFAVLVNDYGEVNIDAQLLQSNPDDELIDLPNGCVCCTLARGLLEVIETIVQADQPPEHILIEASGISSPSQIRTILDVDELKAKIEIQAVVSLVDAANVRKVAPIVTFIEDQIRAGDLLLINKIDLIPEEEMDEVVAWLFDIAPQAAMIKTLYSQVPLDMIIHAGISNRNKFMPANVSDDHTQVFQSWTFSSQLPLSLIAFKKMMPALMGEIYRAKGILYFGEDPLNRYVFQAVGGDYQLTSENDWQGKAPGCDVVFIGLDGFVDDLELAARLEACDYLGEME